MDVHQVVLEVHVVFDILGKGRPITLRKQRNDVDRDIDVVPFLVELRLDLGEVGDRVFDRGEGIVFGFEVITFQVHRDVFMREVVEEAKQLGDAEGDEQDGEEAYRPGDIGVGLIMVAPLLGDEHHDEIDEGIDGDRGKGEEGPTEFDVLIRDDEDEQQRDEDRVERVEEDVGFLEHGDHESLRGGNQGDRHEEGEEDADRPDVEDEDDPVGQVIFIAAEPIDLEGEA